MKVIQFILLATLFGVLQTANACPNQKDSVANLSKASTAAVVNSVMQIADARPTTPSQNGSAAQR